MSQMSFSDVEYTGKRKKTRREVFLSEMEQVVPWRSLLSLIEPFYPVAGNGPPPVPAGEGAADSPDAELVWAQRPGDGGALYENTPMRQFAGLSLSKPIPDETTILNFRHLLEENELAPEILAALSQTNPAPELRLVKPVDLP